MDKSYSVKIKSLYQYEDPMCDLVVKLKNDYINDCSAFDMDVYKDEGNPAKTFVIASNNGHVYSAEPTDRNDDVCQNFLLIVNKKKKRARVLPTNVCDLTEVKTRDENIQLPEFSDYTSKAAHLTEKFGSKRSKRNRDLINKMKVNADVCEQLLKPILDETQIDESYLADLGDGTESLLQLIPPCNRFASTPQSVYSENDLLTSNEKESLLEAAQSLITDPPIYDLEAHSFFINSHYKLISKNVNIDKLILLLYGDCIIRLLKTHPKELRHRDAWNKISPDSKLIASKLKKEFTDSKRLTTQMRHKAICYTLVIVLLSCGFKLHLNLLSSCFPGMDHRKLMQLCRLIGATFQSRNDQQILSLKVPLPPLPVSRSPKKKRR